jgi:hypothetical protein
MNTLINTNMSELSQLDWRMINQPEPETIIEECNVCHGEVIEGVGYQCDEDHFCKDCVNANRHIVYYRDEIQLEPEYAYQYLKSLKIFNP